MKHAEPSGWVTLTNKAQFQRCRPEPMGTAPLVSNSRRGSDARLVEQCDDEREQEKRNCPKHHSDARLDMCDSVHKCI